MRKTLHKLTTILAVLTLLAWSHFVIGQSLPIYEGFDYSASEALGAQANWTNVNSGDEILVISGSLSFDGLPASVGNSISFDGAGMDPYIEFAEVTTGTVYASFIVKVTDQSAISDLEDGGYFAALAGGTSSYDGRLWVRPNPDAAGTTFDFGYGSVSSTPPTSSGTYNVGDVIFIVMSYSLETGETSAWVNPSSASFGGESIPSPTITSIDESIASGIKYFMLRQDSSGETPFIELDELRVGLSWADVTPTAGPDVTAPVPTFVPEDAATDIDIDVNPTITFDEVVYTSPDGVLVDNSNVESLITFTDGTDMVAFSATIADNIITIVPDADLANSQSYSIAIVALEDEAGNAMEADASATFTTISATAQTIELTGDYSTPYYASDEVTVTWNSANIDNVKIEAWVPSEEAWQVMVDSEPATNGTATFTIPADAMFSAEYKIRVSDAADGEPNAESDPIKVRAVAADLATVRAFAKGDEFRYDGEALVTAVNSYKNRKFIEDATAAILIYDASSVITTSYAIGDKMSGVEGKIDIYNELVQLVPLADPGQPVSSGNAVVPTVMTIDQVTSDDQAKLVKLENVTFATPGTFENGKNYDVTDGTSTIVLRTDFYDVDYIGTDMPTAEFNVTGVVIQYQSTMQLVARDAADFEDVQSSSPVSEWGSDVKSYPNPFSHTLWLDNVQNARRVVVINLIGQQVVNLELNGDSRVSVPTEKLSKGVYLISIEGRNGERTVRKVIMK
jgi:hypothetical protein